MFNAEPTIRNCRTELAQLFQILEHKKFREPRLWHGKLREGVWIGKSKASRELKISRPTIDKILRLYPNGLPQKPKKIIPKFVEKFLESKAVKRMQVKIMGLSKGHRSKVMVIGLRVWRLLEEELGKGKDPSTWDYDDYLKVWNGLFEGKKREFWEKFVCDPETGKIEFGYAVGLRKWMRNEEHSYDFPEKLEFTTKGLKRAKGAKKTHYIKTFKEMVKVINAIQNPDTLSLFREGTEGGGRWSSLRLTTLKDFDDPEYAINMLETKTEPPEYIYRYFHPLTFQFLKQYAKDHGISGDMPLFPRKLSEYNKELKEVGEKAEISFSLTSHVAFKHTFVSLASKHGWSLEEVSEQTGTDPNTLREFYLGGVTDKVKAKAQGRKLEVEEWGSFIERLDKVYLKKYKEIRSWTKA